MGKYVSVESKSGKYFSAYASLPKSGAGPGILLISAVYGVNDEMMTLADGYAADGFVVLCPDLFWRHAPGVQLSERVEAERHRAHELLALYDIDDGIDDLERTLVKLREMAGPGRKAGCVGYCLGGLLAYHMAAKSDVDCSVGYYAVGIEKRLDLAGAIRNPLMLHVGTLDSYDTPAAQAIVREAFRENPLVTIFNYPEANHAFARVGGLNYHKESTDLANRRTAACLKENLSLEMQDAR